MQEAGIDRLTLIVVLKLLSKVFYNPRFMQTLNTVA